MAEIAKKRGRPVGSKNVPKQSGGFYVTNLEKHNEGSPLTRNSQQGWVNWGLKNNYPQLLLDLYNESPTHRASIGFEVQSIVGGGVDYDAMQVDKMQVVPNYQYDWNYLLRSIALDYSIYGSYAIEIILNKDRSTYSFYHIPLEKVRWSPYDEDGVVTSYWICNDWSSVSMNPPIEIEAFDTREEMRIEYGKPYLYVFRPYSPTMEYYTSPQYNAGVKAIQSEIEFIQYDLKHIVNGFSAAGVLTLPQVETDDEKKAIINNIQSMFQGSSQANQFAITFRSNLEDKPVEWTPFTDKGSNVDQYNGSNDRCINRILAAHQIPTPMLIGMPESRKSGFSSDADKIETAYQLYERLTGNYHRQCVIQTLNQMLKMNGVDVELIIKPLRFNDFGNDDDKSNDTNASTGNQNISTENINEKVEN